MSETSEFVRPRLTVPNGETKVLLHFCCAPCSGEVMEAMLASGIDYTIFFYNLNIDPEKEYLLRKGGGSYDRNFKTRRVLPARILRLRLFAQRYEPAS